MASTNQLTYRAIYYEVCRAHCSAGDLNIIKSRFKKEISSKRRQDATKTLPELLKVLEKRDYLNEENMEPLETICRTLRQSHILQQIERYNNPSQQTHDIVNNINQHQRAQYSVLPQLSPDPKKRAYDVIATRIGQNWPDFARALEVPEGRIDHLRNAFSTISDRVYEILRYHEDNCLFLDRRLWLTKLLNGLCEARRRDLKDSVQMIFDNC